MDFKPLLKPILFRTGPPPDEVPSPLVRTECTSRRLAALREAGDVLTVLPGPGQSLHAIMTGRYDLTDLLDIILERLGSAAHLRIATLSFNNRNVHRMLAWCENAAVAQLTLLYSHFFQEHNPEIVEQLRQSLTTPHRMAVSRNHCKVVTFDLHRGDKLTVEGSPNLRNNANHEQIAVINDPVLHDWHAKWIDCEVKRHEIV